MKSIVCEGEVVGHLNVLSAAAFVQHATFVNVSPTPLNICSEKGCPRLKECLREESSVAKGGDVFARLSSYTRKDLPATGSRSASLKRRASLPNMAKKGQHRLPRMMIDLSYTDMNYLHSKVKDLRIYAGHPRLGKAPNEAEKMAEEFLRFQKTSRATWYLDDAVEVANTELNCIRHESSAGHWGSSKSLVWFQPPAKSAWVRGEGSWFVGPFTMYPLQIHVIYRIKGTDPLRIKADSYPMFKAHVFGPDHAINPKMPMIRVEEEFVSADVENAGIPLGGVAMACPSASRSFIVGRKYEVLEEYRSLVSSFCPHGADCPRDEACAGLRTRDLTPYIVVQESGTFGHTKRWSAIPYPTTTPAEMRKLQDRIKAALAVAPLRTEHGTSSLSPVGGQKGSRRTSLLDRPATKSRIETSSDYQHPVHDVKTQNGQKAQSGQKPHTVLQSPTVRKSQSSWTKHVESTGLRRNSDVSEYPVVLREKPGRREMAGQGVSLPAQRARSLKETSRKAALAGSRLPVPISMVEKPAIREKPTTGEKATRREKVGFNENAVIGEKPMKMKSSNVLARVSRLWTSKVR